MMNPSALCAPRCIHTGTYFNYRNYTTISEKMRSVRRRRKRPSAAIFADVFVSQAVTGTVGGGVSTEGQHSGFKYLHADQLRETWIVQSTNWSIDED